MNYYNTMYQKYFILKKGNIDDESSNCTTIVSSNITLTLHQQKLLHQMKTLEQSNYQKRQIGYHDDNDYFIDSKMGVLADKSGSGKSITLLSLISIQPFLKKKRNIMHFNLPYVTKSYNTNYINTNLLIIPKYLVSQWKELISFFNFDCYYIQNKSDLKSSIYNYDQIKLVIIIDNMFNEFTQKYNKEYSVSRIIFDQAETINNTSKINACFYWFISNNSVNLLFPLGYYWNKEIDLNGYEQWKKIQIKGLQKSTGFIKNTFYKISIKDFSFIHSVFLKCQDTLLNKSLQKPKKQLIQCLQSNTKYTHIQEIIDTFPTLKNCLSTKLKHYSLETLLSNLNLKLTTRKEYNSKIKLIYEQLINKRKHITQSIKPLQIRLQDITTKITNFTNECCSICYENLSYPFCVTDCCNNLFCFECLLLYFKYNETKPCPICKKTINNLNLINEKKIISLQKITTKNNTIINLINNKKQIIIYMSESFIPLIEKFKKLNITYCCIKGYSKQSLSKFKKGKIQCLLLSKKYNYTGIHFPYVDHLIFYNPVNTLEEQNIIGSIQTIQKHNLLTVYYLQYPTEII